MPADRSTPGRPRAFSTSRVSPTRRRGKSSISRLAMATRSACVLPPLGNRAISDASLCEAESFGSPANSAASLHGSTFNRVSAERTLSVILSSAQTGACRKSSNSGLMKKVETAGVMADHGLGDSFAKGGNDAPPLTDPTIGGPEQARSGSESTYRAANHSRYVTTLGLPASLAVEGRKHRASQTQFLRSQLALSHDAEVMLGVPRMMASGSTAAAIGSCRPS
jgi:hypothetical protein